MEEKRKFCPILVNKREVPDTQGRKMELTLLESCIGSECAAYKDGQCEMFHTNVICLK